MHKLIYLTVFITLIFSCNKEEEESIESHQINPVFSSVTDIEGNEYKTVIIGGQEWMAENLRTSTYCNGDQITNVISDNLWIDADYGAWSFYDNDSSYNEPFGKLYNFYAVEDERNICPCGWRVPTSSDWDDLIYYLKGYTVAGGKLKSKGLEYWEDPNLAATNESGFSALPIGGRTHTDGSFLPKNTDVIFWSDSYSYYGSYPVSAIYKLENDKASINKYHGMLTAGYAIRCVKN